MTPADHDLKVGDTVRTPIALGVVSATPYQSGWPEWIVVDMATDDGQQWNGDRQRVRWSDLTLVARGPRDRSFWTGP